ncbi:MAG: GDSL-type esterase/lipase family protein [Dysgonamonadaceae bacterium]|jgi:lysophospholipase L1-like esterase|nr:GDSL-type esterase/lipase family protein [Dysgonamonadaceae bacterium]
MKNTVWILIFLLGTLVEICGQQADKRPLPNVIDYKGNKILIPGDSSRINNFFNKLDSIRASGQGQLNILHIGGSHVQAGYFSNRVRDNFDEINGLNRPSRGYIFPYTAAKTNNPSNYKVSYKGVWTTVRNVQRNREIPLGVGGIAIYTEDMDAEISILLNTESEGFKWNFDRLLLIGRSTDGEEAVIPILKLDELTYLRGKYDAEAGIYQYDLPLTCNSFTIQFVQRDSRPHRFILNGFVAENGESGVTYHSIGVNGASLTSFLECENFESELRLLHPDMVVFGIGINDASGTNFSPSRFIERYNRLIEMVRNVSPDCAFVFITNNDSFRRIRRRRYAVNRNGTTAREAFFEIAKENGGGVWDLFSIMGGLGSMQKWENAGLAKRDKIHFTREGYYLLGDLFYDALNNYYLNLDE